MDFSHLEIKIESKFITTGILFTKIITKYIIPYSIYRGNQSSNEYELYIVGNEFFIKLLTGIIARYTYLYYII